MGRLSFHAVNSFTYTYNEPMCTNTTNRIHFARVSQPANFVCHNSVFDVVRYSWLSNVQCKCNVYYFIWNYLVEQMESDGQIDKRNPLKMCLMSDIRFFSPSFFSLSFPRPHLRFILYRSSFISISFFPLYFYRFYSYERSFKRMKLEHSSNRV